MIDDSMIRRESGQYDPEIIAQLRLEKLNITRLSGLERCVNLFDLSLAYNDISDIMGLNDLCFLQRLNLSYNKIRKIGESRPLFGPSRQLF